MANSLQSYVEKYLLNPAASFNVDDEDQGTKLRSCSYISRKICWAIFGQSHEQIFNLLIETTALISFIEYQ